VVKPSGDVVMFPFSRIGLMLGSSLFTRETAENMLSGEQLDAVQSLDMSIGEKLNSMKVDLIPPTNGLDTKTVALACMEMGS
jgi:hypothetical protein